MMHTSATIITDSVNSAGDRLTSIELLFPRIVLAEVATHRVYSTSVRSSRAVPIKTFMREVRKHPATPSEFGGAKSGMQSTGPLQGWRGSLARQCYLAARWPALGVAWALQRVGVHKQVANRLLEPWAWSRMIISGTEWENFRGLRCHPDADPTMRELAEAIMAAIDGSDPRELADGEWHAPYSKIDNPSLREVLMMCAARCARVSYKPPSGKSDCVRDLTLANRLASATPMHASPFEHVAQAMPNARANTGARNYGKGWVQLRHVLETEQ